MATRFDNTLQPSNSTDALFRAWCQFIHDTLITTGGWVDPGDTGQFTISTATAPAALNTKVGYRIYRMADGLQGTSPVFMRIDYGSSGAAATPGIWITIGTGSNGSGTITTIRFNGGAVGTPTVSSSANSATASNSYGSASTNRVSIGLFVQTTVRMLMFTIERSKDAAGADTTDGLIFHYTNITTNINASNYIIMGSSTQPPTESGLHYILSANNPSAFGSDVGIGIPIPISGISKQPGYNITITRSSDFIAETTFTMSLYGNTITYQHMNALQAALAPNASEASSRVCMRYD